MRRNPARPKANAAPVSRAVTWDSFVARQAELERRQRERAMDAIFADLFTFCQRLDRAIERVLARLLGDGARR